MDAAERSRWSRNRLHLRDLREVRRVELLTDVAGSLVDEDHQVVPARVRLGALEEELPGAPDGQVVVLVFEPFGRDVEVARDGRRVLDEMALEQLPRLLDRDHGLSLPFQ